MFDEAVNDVAFPGIDRPIPSSAPDLTLALVALLDATEDAVVVVDRAGVIVVANAFAARRYSVAEAALCGASYRDVLPPRSRRGKLKAVAEAFARGCVGSLADRHGSQRLLARFLPVRDAGGQVAFVLVLARDVTAAYQSGQKLERQRGDLTVARRALHEKSNALRHVVESAGLERHRARRDVADRVEASILRAKAGLRERDAISVGECEVLLDGILDGARGVFVPAVVSAADPLRGTGTLTAREAEVVDLVRQGLTSKEIAAILHISARSVEVHRFHVRRKLGLQPNQRISTTLGTT